MNQHLHAGGGERSRHSRRRRHRSSTYLKTRPGRGSERSRRTRALWWRQEHVSCAVTHTLTSIPWRSLRKVSKKIARPTNWSWFPNTGPGWRDEASEQQAHGEHISLQWCAGCEEGRRVEQLTFIHFRTGGKKSGKSRVSSGGGTCVQTVPGVPNGDAVAMQVLLSRPVNFELHMQLPVLQVTRLWVDHTHNDQDSAG